MLKGSENRGAHKQTRSPLLPGCPPLERAARIDSVEATIVDHNFLIDSCLIACWEL